MRERPTEVTASLRGPTAGVLLLLYGRQSLEQAGIKVDGDPAAFDDQEELLRAGPPSR